MYVSADEDGGGDGKAKAARKNRRGDDQERRGQRGEEGGDVNHEESSSLSSDHFSASIGSMGSDLEEHEEDPFVAMEKDLQAQKDEEEEMKRKN